MAVWAAGRIFLMGEVVSGERFPIRRTKLIRLNRSFRNAVMASALVLVSVAAQAATVALKATLNTASEVPAKTGDGSGTLTATLDTSTHELKYHVEFRGLSGPAVAAHFHGPAAPGVNAGPQVAVKTTPIVSPINRNGNTDSGPAKGPSGWEVVLQHPHEGESRGRDSGAGDDGRVRISRRLV